MNSNFFNLDNWPIIYIKNKIINFPKEEISINSQIEDNLVPINYYFLMPRF